MIDSRKPLPAVAVLVAASLVSAADTPKWVLPAVRAPRVQHRTFDSAAAKAKVSFFIYTPKVYEAEKERRFPVMYWLHGTGGGLAGVPKLAAHFDTAIKTGKTPPMLVVFANGLATSMWCDSKDGSAPVETVVVKELVPHVDAAFRTISSREGRLIEGFSMGGYGAARLGFKHPDVFGAVSVLAGGPLDLEFKGPRAAATPEERERILQAVYGGDMGCFKAQSPWVLAGKSAKHLRNKTRVRMATGARDFTLELNRRFSEHLKKLDIPHTFTVPAGVDHNALALLNALGDENWKFYRAVFGQERQDAGTRGQAPNILFILADDVRWDDLGCAGHPFSRTPHLDRIAREGVRFANAFVTTSLCSPSRASFLTGLYPHTHGITDNADRSAASHTLATFPQSLQRAGYDTAFIGKWHMGNDDSRRPGFDHWICLKGQGSTFDPGLNVNGQAVRTKGYVTDILSERAVEFVKRPRTKPFLLWFAHKAVHPETVQRADGTLSDPNASNFIPAERHRNLYADVKVPRRPNAADTLEGKPALRREIPGLPPLGPTTGSSDESILGRLRMLAAVDDSTGDLFAALEATGQLDRTLVVFTSDNGYFYGEHRLSVERRLAYEESIRIPLMMRHSPLIKPGSVREQMVLSIDMAPTLLELAGAPAPAGLHGRSLVPLLGRDGPGVRNAFLIEHFSDNVFPRTRQMGYQAVRTARWKLIHYVDLAGMDELYDLRDDPYEMKNLIADLRAAEDLRRLRDELARQLRTTGSGQ